MASESWSIAVLDHTYSTVQPFDEHPQASCVGLPTMLDTTRTMSLNCEFLTLSGPQSCPLRLTLPVQCPSTVYLQLFQHLNRILSARPSSRGCQVAFKCRVWSEGCRKLRCRFSRSVSVSCKRIGQLVLAEGREIWGSEVLNIKSQL